jgi:hypothetical protein
MRTNASSFISAVALIELVLDFREIIEVEVLADNEPGHPHAATSAQGCAIESEWVCGYGLSRQGYALPISPAKRGLNN